MSAQALLPFAVSEPAPGCLHGVSLLDPCPGCEAETDRDCAAFDAAVERGEFDAQGYAMRDGRRCES